MEVSIFSRLLDAKPDFSFSKFELPNHDFRTKIKSPNLLNNTGIPKAAPLSPQVLKSEKFGKGALTTIIVIGSIAIVLIGTAIIIQTT